MFLEQLADAGGVVVRGHLTFPFFEFSGWGRAVCGTLLNGRRLSVKQQNISLIFKSSRHDWAGLESQPLAPVLLHWSRTRPAMGGIGSMFMVFPYIYFLITDEQYTRFWTKKKRCRR
jgi:hypothetical protein